MKLSSSTSEHRQIFMRTTSLAIVLLLLAASCNKDIHVERHTLDFGKFTIEVPEKWDYVKQQGIDSYVGGIRTSDGQMISFDLGWYSNKLEVDSKTHEIDLIVIDKKQAKVVYPRKARNGTTGAYFFNLDKSGIIKFQISAIDLTERNQRQFLKAIETLKFKL